MVHNAQLVLRSAVCIMNRFYNEFSYLGYSSRMASTGLIDMALSAGANPAKTPSKDSMITAPTAVQKFTWKCAAVKPSHSCQLPLSG